MKNRGMVLLLLVFTCRTAAADPGPAQAVRDLVDGPLQVSEVAGGFTFTEGPAADAAGDVFFTDIPQERIHVWRAATGKIDTWLERTDKLNGLCFRPDGVLVGCQMGQGRRVVNIDPATRDITPLAGTIDGKRFNAPNDLAIDATGGVWFTDPAYGRTPQELELAEEAVYWIAPGGASVQRVAGGFTRPNGIALAPDGKTLYVADLGANVTFAFSVEGPGRLGQRRRFADIGSDGFAMDERGNLYMTPTLPAIRVIAPGGTELGEIPLPTPAANVTFGGPDRRTLFITARDKVFTLPMRVRGGQ